MSTLHREYQDQNTHRRYPFSDKATMVSNEGTKLASDYIIDVCLHVIGLKGSVYMGALDSGARTLTFNDDATGSVCCTGSWEIGDTQVTVVDTTKFARSAGVVVLGPGAATTLSESTMLFTPAATALAANAYVALTQPGVRGILGDDGQLVTGPIKFEGRNGINITSYLDGDNSLLRIDIVGALQSDAADCNPCTPIEQIKIENRDCTAIRGTHVGDGVLAITGINFDLSDMCSPKVIPSPDGTIRRDHCDDAPNGPVDWVCPDDSDDVVPVVNGRVEIGAPSTIATDNPVSVKSYPAESESMRLKLAKLIAAGFKPGGNIRLALKGGRL